MRFGATIDLTVVVTRQPSRPEQGRREAAIPAGDSVLPGLDLATLDAGSRVYFGLPPDVAGVIGIGVEPESSAARAGITEGDVILPIGREPVASLGQAVVARKKLAGGKILQRLLGWQGIRFALLDGETIK